MWLLLKNGGEWKYSFIRMLQNHSKFQQSVVQSNVRTYEEFDASQRGQSIE